MLLKYLSIIAIGICTLFASTMKGQTLTEQFTGTKAEIASLGLSSGSNARNIECTDPLSTITAQFEAELKMVKSITENIATYKTREIIDKLFLSIEEINTTDEMLGDLDSDSAKVKLTSGTLNKLAVNFKDISTYEPSLEVFYKIKRREIEVSNSKLVNIEKQVIKIIDCVQKELDAALSIPNPDAKTSVTITRLQKEIKILNDLKAYIIKLSDANKVILTSIDELQQNVSLFMHTMSETSKIFKTAAVAFAAFQNADKYFEEINNNIGSIQTLSNDLSSLSATILKIVEKL